MKNRVCTMKVTLRGVKPPVWRQIAVPDDITLYALHKVLQAVMPWTDSHLHLFEAGRRTFSVPDSDSPKSEIDEREVLLRELVGDGVKKFVYTYDFGDNWLHDLVVEKVAAPGENKAYPRCIDGKGSCPPENCGGPGGYRDLLAALTNPDSNRELYDWAGDWRPRPFDVDTVNKRLAPRRKGRRLPG